MITSASSAAMGAQITDTNGGDVIIGGGADANATGAFANNDSFHFSNAGHKLATGGPITINGIDLNNQAPDAQGFTVAHNTTSGPITDTGGANKLNVIVNDGITLTLAGTAGKDAANAAIAAGTFDGVGNITLGSGGAAGTLTIDSNATLAGTINSNANAADGIVNVNAGKTAGQLHEILH